MNLPCRPPGRRCCGAELPMPPLHSSPSSLVHSLLKLVRDILHAQETSPPSCAQKGNLLATSHRLRVLLAFLEDFRDLASPVPPSALLCFGELHVVFHGIKLLAEDCMDCSRMSLLMEHRRMAELFHRLTLEMATALDVLPLSLLDVPSEVQEQVELVKNQAKRAKITVDGNEAKAYAEVRHAMGQIERQEAPDASKLSEIFSCLGLRDAEDCQSEIEKLEAEEADLWWDMPGPGRRFEDRKVPLSDLISFVRYCKCVLYGASETKAFKPVAQMFTSRKPNELEELEIKVPEEFLCPISLELMKDPVIIATGQTFERAEIARWIADGNRTCPTSGVCLSHTSLIPNYALRNLIRQWCMQNNVHMGVPREISPLKRRSVVASTPTTLEATKLTVDLLLRQLASASTDSKRHIAGELRLLTKCSTDNRKVIAELGAIPFLSTLLSSPDTGTQEHAITAILNLSIHAPNKLRIFQSVGLDFIVQLMQNGSNETVRENAAAVLFSLSQLTDAAMSMGQNIDAINGLLQIVEEGSVRGRRDAASALFNVAVHDSNRVALVRAGVVESIVTKLASQTGREGMEEEGLALLGALAGDEEGRDAIVTMDLAMPMLGEVLRTSGQKEREHAAAILLALCRYGGPDVISKVQALNGLLVSLHALLGNGSPRARRKASSLLRTLLR